MANRNCDSFDYNSLISYCMLANVDAKSLWNSNNCLFNKIYDRYCQV